MNKYKAFLYLPTFLLTIVFANISSNAFAQKCVSGDCKENYSVVEYQDSSRYEGSFRNGLRWGNGTITYLDGSFYTGQWVEDLPQGRGKYVYADKSFYEGEVQGGKKKGKGKGVYGDGAVYEGEWNDDLMMQVAKAGPITT